MTSDASIEASALNFKAPKWKLAAMWHEVTLPVVAEPHTGDCTIRQLDSNVLIIDANPQVNSAMGFGLFVQLIGLILMPLFAISMFKESIADLQSQDPNTWNSVINIVFALVFIGGWFFGAWLCYMGLIQRSPSPVIFNRKTGKIYGSHRGKPVVLDWKLTRPILTRSKVLYAGAHTVYNLVLMNFDPGQDGPQTKKTGYGIMVATGGAYGAEECRKMWEFFRRYMEESPDRLPPVEITPEGEDWVSKLLDVGPYWEWNRFNGGLTMETLRARKGWPVFSFRNLVSAWAYSLALLVNFWQIFIRPRTKLPASWIPPKSTDPNPYKVSDIHPEDLELRRKAARWVIVEWWIAGVAVGCAAAFTFIGSMWYWETH
jgi:hypothetical protein